MNMKLPVMLVFPCLCLAASLASAQENIFPQGNFKNPGATTDWGKGFNIPQNDEFRVVSENGKSWLRIENHDATRQLDSVHAYINVTPQVESLTISVRRSLSVSTGATGKYPAL